MPMTGKQVHAIMLSSTFVYGEQAVMAKYCPKESDTYEILSLLRCRAGRRCRFFLRGMWKSLPSAAAKVPDDSGYEPADKMEPEQSGLSKSEGREEKQPVQKKERKLKRKSDRSKGKNRKEKKPKEPAPEPESEEKPEDPDYDGYYDDILPPDLDRQREGLDKKLIQRVAVITGVVAVIIGLCVAALYLL